jgi:hypothetical protein
MRSSTMSLATLRHRNSTRRTNGGWGVGARNMMMAEMREARAEGGRVGRECDDDETIRSPVPVLKAFSEAAFDDDERLLRQEVHRYGLIFRYVITGIIIIITGIIIIVVVVSSPCRCGCAADCSWAHPCILKAKSLSYRTCDFLRMSVISSC